MKQYHLKKFRIIIALIFFLFIVFFFLDFRKLLPKTFYDILLYLQFIPSVFKFISATSIATVGFIAVALITALFGRVYCSAICPLGIMQDCILWIKRKILKKSRFRFSLPMDWLRYMFLALSVISYLAGSIFLISLLDPFSIFGRIVSDFFQPVYIFMNNTGARLLEKVHVFFLYPENIITPRLAILVFPSAMLGLILWMSLKWGRLYCNTVCPVGTLLGLFSRLAVFKIRIAEDSCTACGKCALVCKAGCINISEQKVDFSRCVSCYNCIGSCQEDAVKYFAPAIQKKRNSETNLSRRKILSAAGLLIAGIFVFRKNIFGQRISSAILPEINSDSHSENRQDTIREIKPAIPKAVPHNKIPTTIKPDKHFSVAPPGSLGIRHFTDTCTACHLCVSACPTHVLQPSIFEFGILGLMQPYMDYGTNYCTFECIICSEICPSGAILSLTIEAKKTVQIGKVNLILENCVVKTDNTACGSCSENCPTQAVRMIPYTGELTIPEVRSEICVGCGACEHACPTRPYKAIYVDGNYQHQTALLPNEEKLKEEVIEEFPF